MHDWYCPLCDQPVEQTGASVMDDLRREVHESDHRDEIDRDIAELEALEP